MRLWAFGYGDLADLLGVTEGTARRLVSRGLMDPSDLKSIFAASGDRT